MSGTSAEFLHSLTTAEVQLRDRILSELRVHVLRLRLLAAEVESIGLLLSQNRISPDGAAMLWAELWERDEPSGAA